MSADQAFKGAIITLDVKITLRSPFLFQGLANARWGLDAVQIRNESGQIIIPADQLRGVLRAAMGALADNANHIASDKLIRTLFGHASQDIFKVEEGGRTDRNTHYEPERGALFTSDLAADLSLDKDKTPEGGAKTGTLTRIEIHDETGAVDRGALQVVELPAPIGQKVDFTGKIIVEAPPGFDSAGAIKAIEKALHLVPAIGAVKSAGFGEVVKVSVIQKSSSPVIAAAYGLKEDRAAFRMYFDRPILVDARRITGNLFSGSEIVPGAAIKGALASRLKLAGHDPSDDGEMKTALEKLRISHAFPENCKNELSGFPLPQSVVKLSGEKFADILLHKMDSAFDSLLARNKDSVFPPQFQVNWKDKDFEAFGKSGILPSPPLLPELPRTHVEIVPETLVAEEHNLFTGVERGVLSNGKSRAWRVVFDFKDVKSPQAREIILGVLAAGIGPVGRTNAQAWFERIVETPNDILASLRLDDAPKAEPAISSGNLYAITLVTPALMIDPQVHQQPDLKAYAPLIEAQIGGKLLRCFASTELAGGYIATRRRPYGGAFYPFVLTRAGSVFLVEGGDTDKLDRIARLGFEPVKLKGAAELGWRNCPYLPQNGYGEAAFSLIKHDELKNKFAGELIDV